MLKKRKAQYLMAAAMCAFFAAGLRGRPSSPPSASAFWIVSVGFSDVLPGGHHSILEVTQAGGDVLVRYVRVMPSSNYCGDATSIVTAAAQLPNTSLPVISSGVNLCAIDPPALGRAIRAFPQTQDMRVFAGDSYAIVAKCGTDTRVIRLPDDWKIDMAHLKRKRPKIAALWTLEQAVGIRAFGTFPTLDAVPPGMAARLHPAGEAILAELKSGKFDAGLAPRSFKDDVAALRPASDVPEFSVKLANPGHFRFDSYVEPQYPPLAKQARMSGTVELEVTSNPTTGETEQVAVVSGNPLLAQAAKESAQHWRFVPRTDDAPHATRIVLEFIFHCP